MGEETTQGTRSRRAGGRAARVAARSAPLEESLRPIRAGLTGGQYKPLSDEDVARLELIADGPPQGLGAVCGRGRAG